MTQHALTTSATLIDNGSSDFVDILNTGPGQVRVWARVVAVVPVSATKRFPTNGEATYAAAVTGTADVTVSSVSGVASVNQEDIQTAVDAAVEALALGTAASRDVGTTSGTVAAGDDSRLTNARTPTSHASSHGQAGGDAVTVAQSQVTGLPASLAAKADLIAGKIPSAQLPPLTINETHSVESEVEMLALPAAAGDVAIRTDEDPAEFYLLTQTPASTLENWAAIGLSSGVDSVAGHTGVVTLDTDDISGLDTELDAKADSNLGNVPGATIRTVAGLGDSATKNVGTSAGTVAAGDDTRLSDQRTPSNGSVSTVKLADEAVTTPKLADDSVTEEKLHPDVVAAIGAEGVISDGTITAAKLDAGVPAALAADTAFTGAFVSTLGVVCDTTGATSAVSAIQAQINTAATFGIGTVTCPAGTLLIDSSVNPKSNVRLVGAGKGKTVLKATSAVTTAVLLGLSGDAVTDFAVADLTIDCDFATTGTSIAAVQITNGVRPDISIAAKNCGGPAVLLQGTGVGGGCTDATVHQCVIEGTGLSDGTTGHAIWLKDASTGGRVTDNLIIGAKGGMGVALSGSGGTGYPAHATISGNTIRQATSAQGFEAIGVATGCDYAAIIGNNITDSYDNGISVTSNRCTVAGNIIDGTYNHGIALGGSGTAVTGNVIRNVGKQDALAYGGVSLAGAAYCTVVGNRIMDDQGTHTMSYGIKGVSSGGNNVVGLNTISGYLVGEYTGLVSTDFTISSSANADGLTVNKLHAAQVLGPDGSTALILGSSTRLTGIAYVGSSTVGSAQFNVGSNLAASRPCANFVAVFNQAADIWQSRTTAADNTTTTVANGSTSTGRIYSNDGLTTKDVGDITGLTSAQIDALFAAVPANGTLATGLLSSTPVMLARRNGKWNYANLTVIA